MANSIGGVSCSLIRGRLADLKTSLRVWRRPGMDGYAAMDLGKGDGDGALTLVKYDSAADVRTWFSAIEGLQGTLVTIVKEDVTYHNWLLERVSARDEGAALSAEGDTRGRLGVRVKKT